MDCFFKRIIVMQIVVCNKRWVILPGRKFTRGRQSSGPQPALPGEGGWCRLGPPGPGHPAGDGGREPQCQGWLCPKPVGKKRGLGRVLPTAGEKRTPCAQSLMLPLWKGKGEASRPGWDLPVWRLRAGSIVLVEGHQGQRLVTLQGWSHGGVWARSKDFASDAASTHTGPARVPGAVAARKHCIDFTAFMLGGVFNLH